MLTTKEMQRLEEQSAVLGTSKARLMENAGKAALNQLKKDFRLKEKKVVVVSGNGNNGGDGFVLARHLSKVCKTKVVFLGKKSKLKEEGKKAFAKLNKNLLTRNLNEINSADIVVDALLGTGVKGRIREPVNSAIKAINLSKGKKVSLDLPSGLDSDTGEGKLFVKADKVYCFHDLKSGLKKFVKKTVALDIGIPKETEKFVSEKDLKKFLQRKKDSHKGENGKVLIVAGSEDFIGAEVLAFLAVKACYRIGIDLVKVACPREMAIVLNCYAPDLITKKLDGSYLKAEHFNEIMELTKNYDVVLIGPGMGLNKETEELVKLLAENIRKPMVLDADAIKAVKGMKFKGKVLLTPHEGEFRIFSGKKLNKKLDEKIKSVKDVARKHNCTILLKGAIDVVSDGKDYLLNSTGNAGMTVGGTGDILSGLAAGFACKEKPLKAAGLAAFVNGLAGDLAFEKFGNGLMASDMIKELAGILKSNL